MDCSHVTNAVVFAAAAQFVAKWLLSNQTDVLMIMPLARTNGTHFRNSTLAMTLHFSCNLDLIFKFFPPDSQRCSALFIAKDPLCRTNTNANIARMHAPPTRKCSVHRSVNRSSTRHIGLRTHSLINAPRSKFVFSGVFRHLFQ